MDADRAARRGSSLAIPFFSLFSLFCFFSPPPSCWVFFVFCFVFFTSRSTVGIDRETAIGSFSHQRKRFFFSVCVCVCVCVCVWRGRIPIPRFVFFPTCLSCSLETKKKGFFLVIRRRGYAAITGRHR